MAPLVAAAAAKQKWSALGCSDGNGGANTWVVAKPPQQESLVWTVPRVTNSLQQERLERFVEAFRKCDIMQSFNQAEMEESVIPTDQWHAFLNAMIEDELDVQTKARLRRWKFARATKCGGVVLSPKIDGAEFNLHLRIFETRGENIVFKEALMKKSLDVVHKQVQVNPAWRALVSWATRGTVDTKEDAQRARNEQEQELINMTRDDSVVTQFVVEVFGPMLNAHGVKVQLIDG